MSELVNQLRRILRDAEEAESRREAVKLKENVSPILFERCGENAEPGMVAGLACPAVCRELRARSSRIAMLKGKLAAAESPASDETFLREQISILKSATLNLADPNFKIEYRGTREQLAAYVKAFTEKAEKMSGELIGLRWQAAEIAKRCNIAGQEAPSAVMQIIEHRNHRQEARIGEMRKHHAEAQQALRDEIDAIKTARDSSMAEQARQIRSLQMQLNRLAEVEAKCYTTKDGHPFRCGDMVYFVRDRKAGHYRPEYGTVSSIRAENMTVEVGMGQMFTVDFQDVYSSEEYMAIAEAGR